MSLARDPGKWLRKKAKKGARSFPIGTVAFYGPDDRRASKLVAGVVAAPDREADPLRKWFSADGDLRGDHAALGEVAKFFKENGVHSVAMIDRIIGCPHEEGIDYPLGAKCPQCPFWADRDRWSHAGVQ